MVGGEVRGTKNLSAILWGLGGREWRTVPLFPPQAPPCRVKDFESVSERIIRL